MYVDCPVSVTTLARSGSNPIQPAEVLERLREMVVALQRSNGHQHLEPVAD
jgi:hypothetical protein